ncbi:hypothetical protein G9A89_019540 [Geosiphon pyriformis]|nr:hypothetical protein G9A89_019540 [Geosiphon pyriformis]
MIEPMSSSAGGSGLILAGLRTHQSAKNKHVNMVYSHSAFYKKPKKPVAGDVIDSSAGPLSMENISNVGINEIGSVVGSVSDFLDVENMANTVAEETSYMESGEDNNMNNATLRKTCTWTYVLGNSLRQPSFKSISDDNVVPPLKSCVLKMWCFNSTKSFVLDIELSAVFGKLVGDKLISIKKIFYQVNGFGGAFTSSKFPEIIKSSFILESNLNKAKVLVIGNKILVNDDLRKVIVKEIPVDLPRSAVESKAFIEFESSKVASLVVSKWSVFMGKNSALLYILPVGTTAHDLSILVEAYGGKTCFIGHNSVSYVQDRCTVICFEDETSKLAAIGSVPVFKSVSLCWASLSLACCAKCKQFGHVSDMCSVGTGLSSGTKSSIGAWSSSNSANSYGVSSLFDCLASLEWSLELLTNQISDIVRKLSFVELVLLPPVSYKFSLTVSTPLAPEVNLDMVLDGVPELSAPSFFAVVDNTSVSFVTETKLRSSSGLWIKNKYDGVWIFTFGLDVGYLDAGVAIVMDNSLTCHVSKVKVVPGQVISVRLLFKSKLLVSVFGLYTGVSAGIYFGQASEVNSIIAKAVNTSTFMVLGGDFNKCGSRKVLGLVNSFNGHYLIKALTWCNSRSVKRTIDYIFVSESLFFTVVKCWISSVSDFFDTNHNTVTVLVSLGGLLDFKIKNADSTGWFCFRDYSSARILIIKVKFFTTATDHNLDTMWSLLKGALCSKNKQSSKFLGLELLVVKIVKRLESNDTFRFNCLVEKWSTLDANKARVLKNIVYVNQKMMDVLKYLSIVRKRYRKSKIYELKLVQKASIKAAIEKYIEKFYSDKGSMIRSVLDKLFQKVMLDHLVVDDELVLDPNGVRLNVEKIIEGWIRKCVVLSALSDLWAYQYALLDYVRDNTFSGVINVINISELLVVVGGLSDGKATGLFGILNELWKHGSESVMKCLLVLLNKCLFVDEILTNTYPITLIETARKILSKILFNRIFFACSKFGVFHSNNFLVLKSTSTQVLVFAVGSVVKNTLEKNKELWLASLKHIKMCDRFIKFFGNIHKNRINRVMTNFGLSNGYRVHDGLDQGEFVAKLDRVESSSKMSSFFVAGTFVDNTIWIKDCQALIQYALNIASEFFLINDISINSEKTVTIPINQGVKIASLDINRQPIFIAERDETHRYLGIFLSTKGLSKPSLAKAHSDVHFFANVVLRKAITDKQFSYLVSAVLQSIVNYYVLVRKGLKLKAGLFHDFPDAALHYPSLYGLKFFKQIQAENKLAAMFPVKLYVSPVNNFLAGMVKIFLNNELSLANNLPCTFHDSDRLLDKKGHGLSLIDLISHLGFCIMVMLCYLVWLEPINFLEFSDLYSSLHKLWSGSFEIFTDGLLKNFGFSSVAGGVAVYFSAINHSIGVRIHGLMSSTLAELQAVALALKCVSSSSTVTVHFNSQAAIDVCVSKLFHLVPDFQVPCWVKRCYIFDLIRKKDLSISWVKVKGHSGVCDNIKADAAACSQFSLPIRVREWLLITESMIMSGNACYFVRDLFKSVCWAYWKAGPGCDVI